MSTWGNYPPRRSRKGDGINACNAAKISSSLAALLNAISSPTLAARKEKTVCEKFCCQLQADYWIQYDEIWHEVLELHKKF